MIKTDLLVIGTLQISLIVFTFFIIVGDFRYKKASKTAESSADVIRADKSMANLLTVYGAVIASFIYLIDTVSCLEGHRVLFILLNFLFITYLFFFSTCFRNLFFTFSKTIRKD